MYPNRIAILEFEGLDYRDCTYSYACISYLLIPYDASVEVHC